MFGQLNSGAENISFTTLLPFVLFCGLLIGRFLSTQEGKSRVISLGDELQDKAEPEEVEPTVRREVEPARHTAIPIAVAPVATSNHRVRARWTSHGIFLRG